MLLKCCTQYASKFGKLSSGHRTGKGQFSFQFPKESNVKECSNYWIIALISHASEVILKILPARLQKYVNYELTDVQAGFRKGRGTMVKFPTSTGSPKKQSSRKTSTSALLTTPKLLTVWTTTDYGNASRDGNTTTPYLPPEKSVCRSRSNT